MKLHGAADGNKHSADYTQLRLAETVGILRQDFGLPIHLILASFAKATLPIFCTKTRDLNQI